MSTAVDIDVDDANRLPTHWLHAAYAGADAPIRPPRGVVGAKWLRLDGACANNLRCVDVAFADPGRVLKLVVVTPGCVCVSANMDGENSVGVLTRAHAGFGGDGSSCFR